MRRDGSDQQADQLHALVLDAWRGAAPTREANVDAEGGAELGARIARLARLAVARHLAMAAYSLDGSES